MLVPSKSIDVSPGAEHHVARASDAAVRELRALDALIANGDGTGPPVCSALLRAWYVVALLDASLHDGDALPFEKFVDAVERGEPFVGRGDRGCLDDAERRALVATASLPPPPHDQWPSERAVVRQRHALVAWSVELRKELRARFRRGRGQRAVVAVVFAVTLGAALLVVASRALRRPPVWRVVYFQSTNLVDPIASDLTAELGANWGAGSPHPGVPADGFSARWETCMILDRPHTFVFTLGADDGGRLFVDDAPVIDEWKSQPYTEETAGLDLAAGVHTVRVEHFDSGGNAELVLRAKIDGVGDFGSLPRSLLRAPDSGAKPCHD